jgi:GNAT superfamily N-acetyltransferase
MIEVPRADRKQGVGTAVMNELVDYADRVGKRIFLTPGLPDDRHGTTSRGRLVKFYKRFGFVENKGRNKDFTLSPGMYRDPKGSIDTPN